MCTSTFNERGPVERIFEHWVFMMGKKPQRCALGPSRRKVVAAALALYDEAHVERFASQGMVLRAKVAALGAGACVTNA